MHTFHCETKLNSDRLKMSDEDFANNFKNIVKSCEEQNFNNVLFILTRHLNQDGSVDYSMSAIPSDKINSGDEIQTCIKKCETLKVK